MAIPAICVIWLSNISHRYQSALGWVEEWMDGYIDEWKGWWGCVLCWGLSWRCVSACSCKLALTNEVLLYNLDMSICTLSHNTLLHITGAFSAENYYVFSTLRWVPITGHFIPVSSKQHYSWYAFLSLRLSFNVWFWFSVNEMGHHT